jgi:crotonobetainyl-CoA:carnitine CoA-transferase CaiB-like acyl-CoA transferase
MSMDGPLERLRVLEVANWLAGPAAARLLADMGASVIKVEAPAGDTFRYFRAGGDKLSGKPIPNPAFQVDNHGKRSLAVNLDHPQGRAAVQGLARKADVFITNLVPVRLDRYGLRYETLSADNERLIYAAVNAYGAEGPEKDRLGFDFTAYWARSGMMSLVGDRDGPPAMQRSGMGDHITALALLAGIMTALYVRQQTGRGQQIQASLLNTGIWVLASDMQTALLGGKNAPKHSRAAPRNPLQNPYKAGDGRWLLLNTPQADRDWPKVCAALELGALRDDPRFTNMADREEHAAELVRVMEAAIARRTRDEWGAILDSHGIIWAPVQDLAEVIDDPQVRANGYLTEVDHPNLGHFRTPAMPLRFSETRVEVRGPAPELGQHTEEILLEEGVSWEEIGRLRDAGAIGPAQ